jgi:BirA family biotin operon repressor/biotin-[acetyl-CoA-carboxylase] ligase
VNEIDVSKLLNETGLNHVEWLQEIDSTNTRALSLASDPSMAPPFLIGADQQSAGRGRGANPWWGAPGSLMFSIGVDMPKLGLSAAEWPRFSLVTGLAIAEAIAEFLPRSTVGLKWPNDVWVDGRKVCGILIEQGDRTPNRLIVGIGINVNNSFREAPDAQRQIAISMSDAAQGILFSRTEVLISFLSRWNALVKKLSEGTINLAEQWSHRCVLSGYPVTLTSGSKETTGICCGIDDDGSLLLRTAFTTERCYAGTVRLLN